MTALENVLDKLDGAKRSGSSWVARCPAHEDRNPSLSIDERDDGKGAIVKCHANCTTEAITAAIGMTVADLFDDKPTTTSRRIVATYPYHDEHGNVLYEVVRYDPKDFRQRRPDGRGGWVWKLDDTRRVLYRLPELLAADPSATVFVVEGEKDADALVAAGYTATCGPQGAGKWSKVSDVARTVLVDRDVMVVADRDEPGRAHAREVAASLTGIASHVTVIEAASGKDAADHLAAGRTVAEFVTVASTDRTIDAEPLDEWLGRGEDSPPDAADDEETNIPESFVPVDLAEVVNGNYVQPTPTMLIRHGDGIESALIYPGLVNGIHGDSGIGKSWTAVLLIKERIEAGETVMLLDLEDTPVSIVSRLRLIGLGPEQIPAQLIYIRPTDPFTPAVMQYLTRMISDREVTAVVIDSLGEAFGTEGINEDRDNEVGPWLRAVARVLADAGPAVVLVDHSTKSSDRQLHASGSKRKKAAFGGASYLIEVVTGFAKGKDGRLRIVCAKDRHGNYRPWEHVAWLDMTTHLDGAVTLELIAPATEDDEGGKLDAKDVALVHVLRILDDLTEPVSLRRLRALVRESNVKVSNALLDDAIEVGLHYGKIAEDAGPRSARLFSRVRKGAA
jgi:5S rRNA maturation endonuclease (ribonuclease M5)